METPPTGTYFEMRGDLGPPESGEGLAWFAENLLLFHPAPDPSVAPRYNAKAEQTHAELQRAVTALRAALSSR